MNRCSKVDRGLSTVLKVIDVPLAMPDSDDEEIKAEFSICEHAFGYRESIPKLEEFDHRRFSEFDFVDD